MAEKITQLLNGLIATCAGPRKEGRTILAIDGGGARALAAVEILRALQQESGRPIHEMFDLIGGISMGGLVAFAIGAKQMRCEQVKIMLEEVLAESCQDKKSLPLPAFYSTKNLGSAIKKHFGSSERMSAYAPGGGRKSHTFAVGANVTATPATPVLFGNYTVPESAGEGSGYRRNSKAIMSTALTIACAAPMFFEPVPLNMDTFIDASLILKNPTAIAVQEARALWGPNVKINCIVSIGAGVFAQTFGGEKVLQQVNSKVTEKGNSPAELSALTAYLDMFKLLLGNLGNAEVIHQGLVTTLPPCVPYFRLNPDISEIGPDESGKAALNQLIGQVESYIRKHKRELRGIKQACLAGSPPSSEGPAEKKSG